MNRHIKKYFFYLLGMYYDFLDRYDDAVEAYSKVLRYRFFFARTADKFESAYHKTKQNSSLMICGGVGDFLQHLPYMLRNKSNNYVVLTHFPKAKDFFDSIGLKVEKIYQFKNRDEEKAILSTISKEITIYRCPRDLFMDKSPFEFGALAFKNNFPIVGIHMGGSNYAVDKELKSGKIPKSLPKSFIDNLLIQLSNFDLNIIFFGTRNEIEALELTERQKLKFSCDDDITKNLSVVRQCNAFIGSDSAFKTMSSMLKIPTIVLCSAPKNNFRDRMFIDPYIKQKVMSAFKYNVLSEKEIQAAVIYTTNTLFTILNQ